MTTTKGKSDATIYQIKVTLEGSKPPIWRRLLVRSDTTLGDLHRIIQAAFDWWDYHLHQFIVGGTYYSEPQPDYFDYVDMHDEQGVPLGEIVAAEGFKFRYEYDFGDSWLHQVLVEKVLPPEQGQDYPVCIKGRRARPPEDVGGIWGYYHFLEAIRDPNHEEHEEYLEWVGGEFDPEACDLEEVNQALAALRQGLTRQQDGTGPEFEEQGGLALINRGVAIIKPKQPLVDWVKRTVPLLTPLSPEELENDCTAILVPDLGSREAVLDYLEPVKSWLFEMELEDWSRNPSDWPEERTGELFDAWFDVEVHSMVWDLVDAQVEEEGSAFVDLSGTWIVVSSPDFDEDYLYMDGTPYVTLEQDGMEIGGEFQVGLISGSISGRWERNLILFSFEGMDELDPVCGAGTIMLNREAMILRLMFHQGDVFTFTCCLAEEAS